ncbi:cupin domain-containing protein [Beggiatoa alba]|nr:cupin domain-containing protein [Beggiatoa alba]
MKIRYQDITEFVTRDGSFIRELMHPGQHAQQTGSAKQSLAEATVLPGISTRLHRHHRSEELYHITVGQGRMTLADDDFDVVVGDTVCIPPGTPHCIKNTGDRELKILCCCTPAYADDDTELLE